MSDYDTVSILHAARVTLADARKAGDAAAVAAAEAKVAAARAAVADALATGRVTSAAHMLDLDLDCLGAILSHLGPKDAMSTAHTCSTLRSALFRGGLPGPLAVVCRNQWLHYYSKATTPAALRMLRGMEPALGARRLAFDFWEFDAGHARVLARALDAAPHAARIDITLHDINDDGARRLVDILSSPGRAFPTPPQVHLGSLGYRNVPAIQRLTRAGVCVASINGEFVDNTDSAVRLAATSLTSLHLDEVATVNLPERLPALRRLSLSLCQGYMRYTGVHKLTTNVPSLTALAPLLKEIEFVRISTFHHDHDEPPKHGFGFEPRRFARFVAAIHGVTRVRFGPEVWTAMLQNENENLRQLAALRTLRDLEILCEQTCVEFKKEDLPPDLLPKPKHCWYDDDDDEGVYYEDESWGSDDLFRPNRPTEAGEVITNLPPLAPGLTRLAFSGTVRVAFGHPLPALRVLDWRGAHPDVLCGSFYWKDDEDFEEEEDYEHYELARFVGGGNVHVPLAIPSAALAPNLHTLLIGYKHWGLLPTPRGFFDLGTLVAAPTPLRVVVIEHARLLCSASGRTTAASFAALLARKAKDLVSVHMHGCEIEGAHQPAVQNFLRALAERGGRACRTGLGECLFCMLHEGKDLWP